MKNLITFILFSLISFSSLGAVSVTVNRAGTLEQLQYAEFENDEKAEEWIKMLAETSAWGKAAHKKCKEVDRSKTVVESICEDVPSEYITVKKDITSEVQAKKAEIEAKKIAKESRKKKLKEIDWNKVTTVAHVKDLVKALVEEISE